MRHMLYKDNYAFAMKFWWYWCHTLQVPLKLICNLNDSKLNLYVNKVNPDNTWNVDDDNEVGFLRNNLYIKQNWSLVLRFFFWLNTPLPSAKHFADLLELFGEFWKLTCLNEFTL
jgi:hypothetical protein